MGTSCHRLSQRQRDPTSSPQVTDASCGFVWCVQSELRLGLDHSTAPNVGFCKQGPHPNTCWLHVELHIWPCGDAHGIMLDDVFCHLASLSLHAKPGGHPVHLEICTYTHQHMRMFLTRTHTNAHAHARVQLDILFYVCAQTRFFV